MSGTIGIVGMGQTGCSVLRWLLAQSCQPMLFDTRQTLPNPAIQIMKHADVALVTHLGALHVAALSQCELLIVSPGLSIADPALKEAALNGTEIIGDVELFCRFDDRPRIAITGSNGKSTVTTLVTEMLNRAGMKAAAIGNIGRPVMDVIDSDDDVLVMELSSFQLETTSSLRASVACFLNVSPDHLDRYDSFEHYATTKAEIYANAQVSVWNRADALTQPSTLERTTSFGLTQPEPEQWGLLEQQGELWLAKGQTQILACIHMPMLGAHNRANALAALACVDGVQANIEKCVAALVEFNGLPHRCQTVLQHDGITWVNDSKATNEGATLAALNGLSGSYDGRLILLAGGDSKGADFCSMRSALNEQVDELICFGKDAIKLANKRQNARLVGNLEEAVDIASSIGKKGDLILLSPACASLDQFSNYMERGDRFAQLAQEVSR
nr:UDP-N-acetylmuramoyl-L-alanine--D-glutamate ligase [Echinimonas agarilytica]